MHNLFNGFIKRILKLMLKLKIKRKMSLKNKKVILNQRIKSFGYMSKFKRRPRSFDHLKNYKANEVFTWFFYISPLVLRNLLDDDAYGHCMLLVYCVSNFWCGLKRDEIELNHGLLRIFLEDVKKYFGLNEFTINSHLILHLKKSVRDYGPLAYNQAFIYESGNKDIKRLIKSSHGMNEQILSQYNYKFFLNLDKHPEDEKLELSVVHKDDNTNYYDKMKRNGKVYTTWPYDDGKKSSNCFVKLKNGDFFMINSFFHRTDDELVCNGKILRKIDNLKFSYQNFDLELDYIYNCELQNDLTEFNVDDIVDKVHFVKGYVRNSCSQSDSLFVIDLKHIVHN